MLRDETCTILSCVFLSDWISLSGTFLFYGVIAVAAGLFFYFLLPETKGKSLEEIDEELRFNRFDFVCVFETRKKVVKTKKL